MRILILSKEGDALGIAQRMKDEGHEVDIFIQSTRFALAGKGIIGRPVSWRPVIAKSDLVVCDMVGFGYLENTIRRFGKPVFACSRVVEQAELDRAKGVGLFRAMKISTPASWNFASPKAALTILSSWEEPGFVITSSENLATARTYVCRDKETYTWAVSELPSTTALVVQRIVEGIEVSTEGWWNGRSWIKPFNHTFEEKRFMPGDVGPQTGCMGNIVITAKSQNKLVRATVARLEPFLKRTGYRGPVDINGIVTNDTAYALEITARMRYDAIEALTEGLQEPLTDLLFETAMGIKKEMQIGTDFMAATRVSVPPWPHATPKGDEAGRPLVGLDANKLKHVFLTDVYKDEDTYRYAAGDGVVYKATAKGRDLREARRRVLRTIGNISLLDAQYRNDIGARVEEDMGQLKEWGWL